MHAHIVVSIYDLGSFAQKPVEDMLDWVEELEEKKEAVNELLDLPFSNSTKIILTDVTGAPYELWIRENEDFCEKRVSLSLTSLGALGLGLWEFDRYTHKLHREIVETLDRYREGWRKCYNCKEEVKREDIIGNVFHAQYCKDCEEEYRKDDARTSYC